MREFIAGTMAFVIIIGVLALTGYGFLVVYATNTGYAIALALFFSPALTVVGLLRLLGLA